MGLKIEEKYWLDSINEGIKESGLESNLNIRIYYNEKEDLHCIEIKVNSKNVDTSIELGNDDLITTLIQASGFVEGFSYGGIENYIS